MIRALISVVMLSGCSVVSVPHNAIPGVLIDTGSSVTMIDHYPNNFEYVGAIEISGVNSVKRYAQVNAKIDYLGCAKTLPVVVREGGEIILGRDFIRACGWSVYPGRE